jgi:hypothetical protein
MGNAQELKDFIWSRVGSLDPLDFQRAMKRDHTLAMEYIVRLLRITVGHNGPTERKEEISCAGTPSRSFSSGSHRRSVRWTTSTFRSSGEGCARLRRSGDVPAPSSRSGSGFSRGSDEKKGVSAIAKLLNSRGFSPNIPRRLVLPQAAAILNSSLKTRPLYREQ